MLARHEDIAGVHVGVKIIVAKYLGKKDFDTLARQRFEIGCVGSQARDIGYWNTADALHHHDFRAAELPVHEGHVEVARALEIAPQLAGVGGLAHQVEFVHDGGFEFAHHLHRLDTRSVIPVALGHSRQQQ